MPRPKQHVPVLLDEVLHYLDPKPGQSYLDATAGYGGHAVAVLAQTSNEAEAVLIERDANAYKALKQKFGEARIIHGDFCLASKQLLAGGKKFDLILADLGVSSPQLDERSRGFSFSSTGPLDMRMDQRQELSAEDVVNRWSEKRIAEVLHQFGQEPKARQIAQEIVRHRPISSPQELATIVARVWPGHSRRHPATRTFQALRVVVNGELDQLSQALPIWLELLNDGGRLAIISFNSLEDKLVKDFFKEESKAGFSSRMKSLTPKPVTPGLQELAINQRARSAKLRAASKLKQTERING